MIEFKVDYIASMCVIIILCNPHSVLKFLTHTHNQISWSVCNLVGLGFINANSISLVDLSFMADPPSFTLIGNTTGGPPEISAWIRNGVTISNGDSYSISLTVPGVTSRDTNDLVAVNQIFQQSRYRSTLTVTGNLPGVYVYAVINRAMSASRTASFTIEGWVYRYVLIIINQARGLGAQCSKHTSLLLIAV